MNVWACLTIVFGVLAMMLFFEVLNQKETVKEAADQLNRKEEVIKRCTKEIQDKTVAYDGAMLRIQTYQQEQNNFLEYINKLETEKLSSMKNPVREFKVVTTCKAPVALHYAIEMPYDISDCPNIQREVTKQAIEELVNEIISKKLYIHNTTTNFTTCGVRHEFTINMFKED